MMKKLQVRQRLGVTWIPVVEDLPVPAKRGVVEAVLRIQVDCLPVVALVCRVAQQSLDLFRRASLVAGTPSDE